LQKFWPSVHHRLITYAGDMLASRLPSELNLFIEERIVFETGESENSLGLRGYVPDVAVVQSKFDYGSSSSFREQSGSVAEPITIEFLPTPITQGFIEIRDGATGGKVITTIEFISPSNKLPGLARDVFLRKQGDMRLGQVSLVEIDLVRGGEWVVSVPEIFVKPEARTDLKISVIRGWANDVSSFYPIKLNQRLPTIPIPLRKTDEPLLLDLQALFDLCYERGRYADVINYSNDALPPLQREEKRWAEELLRSSGKKV
jgi:hypothetical protein